MKVTLLSHIISWYFCGQVLDGFEKVCRKKGFDFAVMDFPEYYFADPKSTDLFFGVDTSEFLDFTQVKDKELLKKTSFWYTDSRLNPKCDQSARYLTDNGGWAFECTSKDVERVKALGINRVSWLACAANPDIWSDVPKEPIKYRASFIGNLYEPWRGSIINDLQRDEALFWPGQIGAVTTEAAEMYRRSGCGFNVPTFYRGQHEGNVVDFGVNMRVFEVQSCGIPLVTNYDDDLISLGFDKHTVVYRDPSEIHNCLIQAIERRDELGKIGSDVIRSGHTYEHRAITALAFLKGILY